MTIEQIEKDLFEVRQSLKEHSLYEQLSTIDDIRTFMQGHVYAVWDFMSLLKSLQQHLTCTSLPWKPVANPVAARFINEIVLEEETDVNELGQPKSHFEMYLDAMHEVDADTDSVLNLINELGNLDAIEDSIERSSLHHTEKAFLKFTFLVIKTKKPHVIAAAFTFGREEVIPDMFLEIVEQSTKNKRLQFPKLTYYLKRHIELDGDEHGPLALQMIQELCGTSISKWNEVAFYGKKALEYRVKLWDGILERLPSSNTKELIQA